MRVGWAWVLMGVSTANAMAEPGSPRMVAAWLSGPLEARIAFDRALDPTVLGTIPTQAIRFVSTQPGESEPGRLVIAQARLEDTGRTLVLVTDPHPIATKYALDLQGIRGLGDSGVGTTVHVEYSLNGVEAEWVPTEAEGSVREWSGWLPSLDLAHLRRLAVSGSASHATAADRLRRAGRLELRTQIALPSGAGRLRLRSNGVIAEVAIGNEFAELETDAHEVVLPVESAGIPLDLVLTVETGAVTAPLVLEAWTRRPEESEERPLNAHPLFLPWAPPPRSTPGAAPPLPRSLTGGDPRRGEAVFFSEEARCSTCHRRQGQGENVGPDLSDLRSRDLAGIYREIAEPSAVIAPHYVPYTVITRDGRVLAGLVRSDGRDSVRVIGTDAQHTIVARSDIAEIRPSGTSIMPVGLAGALGEAGLRDLLAYLASPGQR